MPAKYDRCVAKVKRDIRMGKVKKGSNPHAICSHVIKGYNKKEKREFKGRGGSGVGQYIRGKKNG